MPYRRRLLTLRDPKLVARRYVARHPTFAACRVEGHWFHTVERLCREVADDLEAGVTIVALCQRCGSRRTRKFDSSFRDVREQHIAYPEGWNAFGIRSVEHHHLRSAFHWAALAAVRPHANP